MYSSGMSKPVPPVYLPLTYGQKWCMGEMQKIERPGWYCIDFMVKTKKAMDEQAMKESVYYLVNKYESLRVRITGQADNWVQDVYPLSEADPFTACDLSAEDHSSQLQKIKQLCMKERDELLPQRGNLVRVLFFKLSEQEGRLWFCLHHMVSDFVSVLIFSGEFMAVYNSVIQGKVLKWDPVNDYRKWLYMVDGYCRDILMPAELDYWQSLPWEKAAIIPSDYPERFPADNIIVDAIHNREIVDTYVADTYWLDQEATLRLFNRSGAEFEAILIAVFFLAIANHKGMNWLDISVCNSGRNILPQNYGVNVNNLLGFLSTTRALLLSHPGHENLSMNIRALIDQMKRIPHEGLGFILISGHIKNEQLKNSWFNCRQPGQIFFNYLGRVNTSFSNEQYETVDDDTGVDHYKPQIRNNLLACDIGIKQHKLCILVSYSELYFKKSTIEDIIQSMMTMFREIVSGQIMDKVA